MNKQNWLLTLILVVIAAYSGWTARGRKMDTQAQVQVAVAAQLHTEAQNLRAQAEDADHAAAASNEKVLALEKQIWELKVAKRPAPLPVPGTAPLEVQVEEVAPLRASLADCEAIRVAQEQQAFVFRQQVELISKSRDYYRSALDAETKRGDTLQIVTSFPRWTAGLGASVDPRDGSRRPSVYFAKHINRSVQIGTGFINGGYFVLASYSWGVQ